MILVRVVAAGLLISTPGIGQANLGSVDPLPLHTGGDGLKAVFGDYDRLLEGSQSECLVSQLNLFDDVSTVCWHRKMKLEQGETI